MKQEAPEQRHSRTGIPAIHNGAHVNTYDRLLRAARCAASLPEIPAPLRRVSPRWVPCPRQLKPCRRHGHACAGSG